MRNTDQGQKYTRRTGRGQKNDGIVLQGWDANEGMYCTVTDQREKRIFFWGRAAGNQNKVLPSFQAKG